MDVVTWASNICMLLVYVTPTVNRLTNNPVSTLIITHGDN